jgi:hypothetical protein
MRQQVDGVGHRADHVRAHRRLGRQVLVGELRHGLQQLHDRVVEVFVLALGFGQARHAVVEQVVEGARELAELVVAA